MLLRQGSQGEQVERLQRALARLKLYAGKIDGDFGPVTEAALEAFQRRSSILADGVFGSTSMQKFNRAVGWDPFLCFPPDLVVAEPQAPAEPRMEFVQCPADKVAGVPGYGHITLREDVAAQWLALTAAVHERGGVLMSGGGKRRLHAKSSPSRSRRSMHYLGRAFDLPPYALMQNPNKDPYLVTDSVDQPGRFEVWCRSDDAPMHGLNALKVKQWRDDQGRRRSKIVPVWLVLNVFSLTKLAKAHGFEDIRARRSFVKGGSYAGCEAWHHEYRGGLVPDETTFGEELMRVYSPEQAQKFIYWYEVRDSRWKGTGWG